jgi:8-hydroxy-5-deazaflavin:NADPH oxidoreductase
LAELVGELGDHARAETAADAAAAGDIVVVSIPLRAYRQVPVEPLAGKVVIDTNNYYPQRDGQIPELDDQSTTSSELLQAHLPNAKVVKAFNNILWSTLGSLPRPRAAAERSALPIAGDDREAKAAVAEFLDRIGYDSVDAGSLAEGRRFQPDTPAYGTLYAGPGGFADARPATADQVRTKLAEAARSST